MEVSEIEKIARETHVHFVDAMWERFGLSENPGYCLVTAKPMFSSGGFFYGCPDNIWMNDLLLDNETDIVDTACHESSHFLHPFSRKMYGDNSKKPARDQFLSEVVAHLGTMVYLGLNYGSERINNYLGERPYNESLIAHDVFEGDRNLLTRLANVDMVKAKKLILPHLKRPLERW